jgi:hypothetical protein
MSHASRIDSMGLPLFVATVVNGSTWSYAGAMKSGSCALCGKLFKSRPNKRYCSDRCRFQAWMRGKEEPAPPCHYCGMPADTVDHVPPRSVRSIILQEGATRWPFVEVDACHECNSLLGAQPPWTVSGRKDEIKKKLQRKYRRYLKIPRWTDEELAEYDKKSTLGSFIHEGVMIKRITEDRLKW